MTDYCVLAWLKRDSLCGEKRYRCLYQGPRRTQAYKRARESMRDGIFVAGSEEGVSIGLPATYIDYVEIIEREEPSSEKPKISEKTP